jgi:hypothetical protein
VLGTSAAKEHAERNHPGASARWVNLKTSVKDALRYYDEENGALKCSFCGRRPFDLKGWLWGKGVTRCKGCVQTYYRAFCESDSDTESGV